MSDAPAQTAPPGRFQTVTVASVPGEGNAGWCGYSTGRGLVVLARGVGGHDEGHSEAFGVAARFCQKTASRAEALRTSPADARAALWEAARESLEATSLSSMFMEATVLVHRSSEWHAFSCGSNRVLRIAGAGSCEIVAPHTADRALPPGEAAPDHVRGIATRMLGLESSAESFDQGSTVLTPGTGIVVVPDASLASIVPRQLPDIDGVAAWFRETASTHIRPNRRFAAVWHGAGG